MASTNWLTSGMAATKSVKSGDGSDQVRCIRGWRQLTGLHPGWQQPSQLHREMAATKWLTSGMAATKSVKSGDGRDQVSCIRGWHRPSKLHPEMEATKWLTSGMAATKSVICVYLHLLLSKKLAPIQTVAPIQTLAPIGTGELHTCSYPNT